MVFLLIPIRRHTQRKCINTRTTQTHTYIQVGADSLAGKEQIVLKGLQATRRNLDDFVAYFPSSEIEEVQKRIKQENDLNEKEFDSSLGVIINLRPVKD